MLLFLGETWEMGLLANMQRASPMTGWSAITGIYAAELPLSGQSAFITHGLATWLVLLGGWATFCLMIEWVGVRLVVSEPMLGLLKSPLV